MGKYQLKFTVREESILHRSEKIKSLAIFALKEIESEEDNNFYCKVRDLYNSNLQCIIQKYNYKTLHEYCTNNGITSFYRNGRLRMDSAFTVMHYSTEANVPILKTLNNYRSWVNNYPSDWLDALIPALIGQPSIGNCYKF